MRGTQRLDKVLSNFGFGTRSEIRQLVKNGIVKVDGVTVKDSSMQVNPENCVIDVEGEILNYREFIYIMMNKPAGVISATEDNKQRTVLDILPEEFKCFELFPAGRLDIDTEGLLLLTNDGKLAHELLSPRKHVPKRYYALVDGIVGEDVTKSFKEGVTLDDGYKTMPAELFILKAGQRSEIELVLHEGKFHQVKRMFEAVDRKVLYLKRIRMGGLELDPELAEGECRELTVEEVRMLKSDT
ncbi:MAG: 16S rRNA pseudouridine(516) synthase [Clostridiales bacterium GWC2_40_7]|nr:MAG: 16S rRNA pseudouridine(516) synthase [Clostridiales bacterium GWC2_40_7]